MRTFTRMYYICLPFSSTARPTIVDLTAPDTNTEGERFELVCTFTGVPPPMIRWEKDGSVFLLGEGRRIINSTGRSRLEINSLALSDAGVYSCSVSNVADTDMRSVRLEVRGEGVSSDYQTLTCYFFHFLSCAYTDSPCTAAPPQCKLLLHPLLSNVQNYTCVVTLW